MHVDLKQIEQIDCWLFLQQEWVFRDHQGIAICGLQLWQSICKFPCRNGENAFIEGKGREGGRV